MADIFVVRDIDPASTNPDGTMVQLTFETTSGLCRLHVPLKMVGRVAAEMFSGSMAAKQVSKEKGFQAINLHGLKVLEYPGQNPVLLADIHSGGAPLALSLPKQALIDLARSVLETEGLLPVESSGRTQ